MSKRRQEIVYTVYEIFMNFKRLTKTALIKKLIKGLLKETGNIK